MKVTCKRTGIQVFIGSGKLDLVFAVGKAGNRQHIQGHCAREPVDCAVLVLASRTLFLAAKSKKEAINIVHSLLGDKDVECDSIMNLPKY